MKGGQYLVAGQGSLDCRLGGKAVTDLAHDNDIRVLAHIYGAGSQ